MKTVAATAVFCLGLGLIAPAFAADQELRENREINEAGYMAMGCLIGAAGGAAVGGAPIVTGWGVVVTPYTVPQAALLGCMTGTSISAVAAKIYNYLAAKFSISI